jgi:hypothetical protein
VANYCQGYSFATIMYFLVLLSTLIACIAVYKCTSYGTVILDCPEVQDLICIYELSDLYQSTKKVNFLSGTKISPRFVKTKCSLQGSQTSANCLHPEPKQSISIPIIRI